MSVINLIRKIQFEESDGIIFYLPEEWQISWSIKTKQSFISALSMLSGNIPNVVLICKSSDQFSSINQNYFKLIKSVNENCEILVPQKSEH